MQFLSFLGPSPRDVMFRKNSIHTIYVTMYGKLYKIYFIVLLFLYCVEKVQNGMKTMQKIFLLRIKTFSPQFYNNNAIKCSSISFSYMVTSILVIENCWNIFLMYIFFLFGGEMVLKRMHPGFQKVT